MIDGDAERGHAPRQQLSDEVASHVRELIMSGRLRPGEFIRQERIAAVELLNHDFHESSGCGWRLGAPTFRRGTR
jgi:hypothetical protein